jgi:hypothetical protein
LLLEFTTGRLPLARHALFIQPDLSPCRPGAELAPPTP